MTHIIIENFRFQLIHIFLIHNPSSCKPIKPDQARINQIKNCSLGFLREKLIFTKGANPGILSLWRVT